MNLNTNLIYLIFPKILIIKVIWLYAISFYFFTKEGEFMQENNLKGLSIPYEILTNKKLSDKKNISIP